MKYCEEIVKQIESMLSIGVSNKSCAEAIGINEETFYKWMKKDKFSKRVKKAKALGKVKLLKNIDKDASWQSSAWKLERIWPEEFGKKLELSGNKDRPLEIRDFRNASKEELMKLAGLASDTDK